jgi:hypothetical protein
MNADLTKTVWAERIEGLTACDVIGHAGLWLFPLIGARDGNLNYVTLSAAVESGAVTVTETSQMGTVPRLKLENHGRYPVLVLDGEELVGAKQNRIVNTSIMVEAGGTVDLPVSCVEAGRWRHEGPAFRSERSQYNARGRQKKMAEVSASLTATGSAFADQGRVWTDIEHKLSRMHVDSGTRALHDIIRTSSHKLSEFRAALGVPASDQVGAVFALGPRIVGMDIFDRASTYASVSDLLNQSWAVDAIDEMPQGGPPDYGDVREWLHRAGELKGIACPTVGLGQDVRLSGPGASGSALVVSDTPAHIAVFATADEGRPVSAGRRIVRGSVRRGRSV